MAKANRKSRFQENDEATIGIGTLIVFIALVLVAAIAAAVIIKTAGELEQRAQQTGTDAARSATGGVAILSTVGRIQGGQITEVYLIIQLAAGSSGVDLDGTIVSYRDDTDYDENMTHVFTTIVDIDSDNTILGRGETMNLTVSGLTIQEGETFSIKIIPPHRVPATTESYIAPESFATYNYIDLV